MSSHVSTPEGSTSNENSIAPSDGVASQGGAKYPPYTVEGKVVDGKVKFRVLQGGNPNAPWVDFSVTGNVVGGGTPAEDPFVGLRAIYGADNVYPPLAAPPAEDATSTGGGNSNDSNPDAEQAPYDPRLVFVRGDNAGLIYSFSALPSVMVPLVDGVIIADPTKDGESIVMTKEANDPNSTKKGVIEGMTNYYGVPSIMNDNMYVSLIASGGKIGNQYLRDLENQPRWYDMTANNPKLANNGKPMSATAQLTIKDLVDWSEQTGNLRFPYRFQDFVFCKYWKKIPLNYMITLRRYTRPVIDNVTTQFDHEYKNGLAGKSESRLSDAARAVTFLGEETGNKISSILGPITAGLKWKDLKAQVWEIQGGSGGGGSGGTADTPLPGIAKLFAFLQGGVKKNDGGGGGGGGSPQDPYNNGPYANKVIGPLTVIDSVKARDRGIEFKHAIKLTFEYSARAIGGINAKAALLDILGNMMILTFNEAAFWGGYNRHMPGGGGGGGGGGEQGPFLGGKEGKKAWLAGDPEAFFKSVVDQFNSVLDVVGDFFKELQGDPVATLMGAGTAAAKNHMKLNSQGGGGGGGGSAQALHALLTGDPVGEWHVTVGNPMNPMMMIGNLICTGITFNFNDELGPDDFPTEAKFEVSLEHGMPRDRAAIEGMFNKGSGRIYSFPPGLKESEVFSSYNQTAVDRATGGKGNTAQTVAGNELKAGQSQGRNGKGASYSKSQGGRLKHLIDDPGMWERSFGYAKQTLGPTLKNFKAGFINAGFTFTKEK